MITNEQADFFRLVFRHINSPDYGICFICGFNVNANKNNDSLFMSLIVNAENYLICPDAYDRASEKIEKLPVIHEIKQSKYYLCIDEKTAEIRW